MELSVTTMILAAGIVSIHALDNTVGKEFELVRDLLSSTRYNPKLKPRRNNSDIINVTTYITIRSVLDVIEIESKVLVSARILLEWTDEYLKWDPTDYGNIKHLAVPGADVWRPELIVINRIGDNFLDDYSDAKASIDYTGAVKILPKGQITINCPLSPQFFPFDCHQCSVQYGLKDGREYGIKFYLVHIENAEPDGTPIWDITVVNTYIEVNRQKQDCIHVFQISRKSYYYLVTIVMPSSFLAVLNIATLFIPSEEGERISCGMTVFLTCIVFLAQVLNTIPSTSDATPAIGIYFTMLMVSSIFTTLDSVYTSKFPPTMKEEEINSKNSDMAIIRSSRYKIIHIFSTLSKFHILCVMATIVFTITAYMVLLNAYFKASCLNTE